MDRYVERSTTSYGERITNSFGGILFGIILIIGSIILLWWNESRSFAQAEALHKMEQETVIVNNTQVDTNNQNKLLWLYGKIEPLKTVVDDSFRVTYDGLQLKRLVQMYQWKESKHSQTKENLGGSSETITTYNYNKDWSSYHINSSSFKVQQGHKNPLSMPYKDATFTSDGKLGEFYLSEGVIANLPMTQTYPIDNFVSNIASNHSSFFYIGDNPDNPKIGDIKISYLVAPKGEYSIIAKQYNKSLIAYKGSNDSFFLFIRKGYVTAQEIYQEEKDSNTLLTWGLRALGLFLMFIGFLLVLGPLSVLASIIPFVGSFVGAATALISFIITFILGTSVIIVAWFGARPWVLGVVLISIIALVIFLRIKQKNKNNQIQMPPPRKI